MVLPHKILKGRSVTTGRSLMTAPGQPCGVLLPFLNPFGAVVRGQG